MISAVLLAAITVAYIVAGGWYFTALMIVICGVLAYEWVGLMQPATIFEHRSIFAILGCLLSAIVISANLLGVGMAFLGTIAVIVGLAVLGTTTNRRAVNAVLGGTVYIGLPALSLLWLRNEQGAEAMLVLWLFLIVWSTDTGAFLVGSVLGGVKLAPRISPGKTWSGAVGGAAIAAVIGGGVSFLLGGHVVAGAALAVMLSVLAQLGDLFESILKRRAQVKHSSDLIPGHGGMLDRLDGLLFAAPAMAAVMILVDPRLIG